MTSKEALNDIKKRNNALKEEGHFHIGTNVMSVIEDLVERDTPMKVIMIDFNAYCDKCGNHLSKIITQTYCDECGQRLDWSDDV